MWHIILFLVVEARLDQLNYTVSEDDGIIEVCVVLNGMIHRSVEFELSTEDNTAIGNKSNLSLFLNYYLSFNTT